jgi:hypothetical protein
MSQDLRQPAVRQVLNDRGILFCLKAYLDAGLNPADFSTPSGADTWLDADKWRQWLSAVASGEFTSWVSAQSAKNLPITDVGDRPRRLLAVQRMLVTSAPALWSGSSNAKMRLERTWDDFEPVELVSVTDALSEAEMLEMADRLDLPSLVNFGAVRTVYWAPFPTRQSLILSPHSILVTMPSDQGSVVLRDRWTAGDIAALLPRDADDRGGPQVLSAGHN